MKFSENNIPRAIFCDLSIHDFYLCLAESKPLTMLVENLSTILSPEPESEEIPEHRAHTRREKRPDKMRFSPESSDQNHDIHPRKDDPDNRKWLDACWEKCDQIIPHSYVLDEIPDPCDHALD